MKTRIIITILISCSFNYLLGNIHLHEPFETDTINITITPTVYVTEDTSYNCYIIKDEKLFFYNKSHLEQYISFNSGLTYEADLNTNTISFEKFFHILDKTDTLGSVIEPVSKYFINGGFVQDNYGVPILWYDLVSSYLFNLFGEHYSDESIYMVNLRSVNRTDMKYFPHQFLSLFKLEMQNNSAKNFFFYTTTSKWENDSIIIDSTSISSKKLSKIKNLANLVLFSSGNIFPIEKPRDVQILFIKNNRYILKNKSLPLNIEGMTIIETIYRWGRKSFHLPYNEKK